MTHSQMVTDFVDVGRGETVAVDIDDGWIQEREDPALCAVAGVVVGIPEGAVPLLRRRYVVEDARFVVTTTVAPCLLTLGRVQIEICPSWIDLVGVTRMPLEL